VYGMCVWVLGHRRQLPDRCVASAMGKVGNRRSCHWGGTQDRRGTAVSVRAMRCDAQVLFCTDLGTSRASAACGQGALQIPGCTRHNCTAETSEGRGIASCDVCAAGYYRELRADGKTYGCKGRQALLPPTPPASTQACICAVNVLLIQPNSLNMNGS
jgi:hypothetical protein